MKGKSREWKSYAHHVKISIEGFQINRLLTKASKIKFREITYVSETEIRCYIDCDDLKELKKLAKPLYKITVLSNEGLEYRVKGFLKRPMMVGLTVITTILVISQSYFVKTIEISGYKGIPEIEIRECLAESGIKEGSFIPNINWQEAENNIYDAFPEVSWLRLVYDGRKVYLDISEGEIKTQKEEPKYYCNVIADQSGFIDTINVYRGVALIEKGDYVEKGEILILGCVPIKEKYHRENAETEYLVKSKGDIWAIVPHRLSFEQDLYDENGLVKNKEQIIEKAEQEIRKWDKENLPENAEILNKDLNFSYKENIIEVGVTLEIRRQIGEEQEILIGQKN